MSDPQLCPMHDQCMKNIERIDANLQTITTSLVGNSHPGLKIRVDRIEQQAKTARWFLRLLVVAVVGTLVAQAIAFAKVM